MIYFDNAATTFPKPLEVKNAVLDCIEHWCGNPGRGAHELSLAAATQTAICRERLASFLGLNNPSRIVFTAGATAALNTVIKGILRQGDHVLYSELEHNAVRRPLQALVKSRGIRAEKFPVVGLTDTEIVAEVAKRVKKNTCAVICTHMSNVCSLTLPLAKIGAYCRQNHLYFIVDGAQSVGHLPIHMEDMCIDALALPAHKGLYGIPGCGVLALGKRLSPEPLLEGGSGVNSRAFAMPRPLPERLEAGTLPIPAIAGLLGGLTFVERIGLSALQKQDTALFFAVRERIEALPQYRVILNDRAGAVLLFCHQNISAVSVASALAAKGIAVRAGQHCAPLAHDAIGTGQGGGVRISFSYHNTLEEVDSLYLALKEIEKGSR